jgi:thioredoxin reductase (NADPH)
MISSETPDFEPESSAQEGAEGPSVDLSSRRHQMFPRLSENDLRHLQRFGIVHNWPTGASLFEAGRPGPGMVVILKGRVAVSRHDGMGHKAPVIDEGRGHFMAEVGQLSGRPSLVDGHAAEPVEALVIRPESLRALVVAEAELGERIMRALILRRVALIRTGGGGPVLVGAADASHMNRLQGFLARNGHPYTSLDPASDADASELLKRWPARAEELPLVVCPDGTVLKNPSEAVLGHKLGLIPELRPDAVYDVVVVGAGPAGLATAVYAASEALSVLVLDARAFGGQAGASSRIENYLGFPTGISGQALAGRAFVQAQKFGAEVAVPVQALRLDCDASPLVLECDEVPPVRARTVVIASGAKYRHPAITNLEDYEGRGVYYWASPIEAKLCRMEEVILVGGGNSAGQAAVFLAAHAVHLHLVVRGPGLAQSMSSYLIHRIRATANITLHSYTEIVALDGDAEGLRQVTLRNTQSGADQSKPIRRVFLFVGADPNTDWLRDCHVDLDDNGFVLTGQGGADRLPLETSVEGVFAIGDVRADSTKRVAAAVGEGAAVVAQIHTFLGRTGNTAALP